MAAAEPVVLPVNLQDVYLQVASTASGAGSGCKRWCNSTEGAYWHLQPHILDGRHESCNLLLVCIKKSGWTRPAEAATAPGSLLRAGTPFERVLESGRRMSLSLMSRMGLASAPLCRRERPDEAALSRINGMLKVPFRCGLMGGLPLLKLATGPCWRRMRAMPCRLLGIFSPSLFPFLFPSLAPDLHASCDQQAQHAAFQPEGQFAQHLAPVH